MKSNIVEVPSLWCFYVQTPDGTVRRDVYAATRGEAFYKVAKETGQKDDSMIRLFRLVKGNDSIEYL